MRAGAAVSAGDAARYLTVPDIAGRLQVADKTVRKWIRAGALPASRFGGLWRVREDVFARFEARARVAPDGPR